LFLWDELGKELLLSFLGKGEIVEVAEKFYEVVEFFYEVKYHIARQNINSWRS